MDDSVDILDRDIVCPRGFDLWYKEPSDLAFVLTLRESFRDILDVALRAYAAMSKISRIHVQSKVERTHATMTE